MKIILALLIAAFCVSPCFGENNMITPKDTGQALVNPGMGWTMHFYSNVPSNYGSKLEPSDALDWFPGCSTVFMRIPWAFIEPEEGVYNWAILDTPAQRWISRGKKIAICITSSENWIQYATPEWVKNAGAKGVFYDFPSKVHDKGKLWDPDFGDKVFLEKLDKLVSVLARRYDNNPDVAFVGVGSYGLWGEGHTMMSSMVPEAKADKIIRKHIDIYAKHFRHAQLCISDDIVGPEKPGKHFPLTDYALSKNVTIKDDSIMVQPPPKSWFHADMVAAFWPRMPVIIEHEHFGSSKDRGAWGDGSLLLEAVEQYHASYLSIHWWPEIEYNENKDLIGRINLRLGYRLQLRELTMPQQIRVGEWFEVSSKWVNAGVAACYPGGFMALTFKDSKSGIVSVLCDTKFNMKSLQTGPAGGGDVASVKSDFRVGLVAPVTATGSYDVYISVGREDGTPVIALPLPDEDGQRRYKIGRIEVI